MPLIGGVNQRVDPRFISDVQAAELLNVLVDDPGQPEVRDGYGRIKADTAGILEPLRRIGGLGYLNPSITGRGIVAAIEGWGDEGGIYMHPWPDSTVAWTRCKVADGPEGPVSPEGDFNPSTDAVRFFEGAGMLFIIPGPSQNMHALRTTGKLIDLGDVEKSPPKGVKAGLYQGGRMWVFTGKRGYWSKFLLDEAAFTPEPLAFARTTDFLDLLPNQGGEIVAVRSWQRGTIVVAGESQIEVLGVNNANPFLSSRLTLEESVGVIAPRSMLGYGNEFYFMDQYCELRTLRQSISAEQQGVAQISISDPIRPELSLSGRINTEFAHRSFTLRSGPRVLFFYPRDASEECNACAVLNTQLRGQGAPYGIWEGVWLFAHGFSSGVVSNIRGMGDEIYLSDGADVARVYRFGGGVYSDDGEDITYQETSKAWTGGDSTMDKRPEWAELGVNGSVGVKATLALRTREEDGFSIVGEATVAEKAGASFPIADVGAPTEGTNTQFPLDDIGQATPEFPLVDSVPIRTVVGFAVEEEYAGDFSPLPDAPWFDRDFPMYGKGFGVESGPVVQTQIRATVNGKKFIRSSYRVDTMLENPAIQDDRDAVV